MFLGAVALGDLDGLDLLGRARHGVLLEEGLAARTVRSAHEAHGPAEHVRPHAFGGGFEIGGVFGFRHVCVWKKHAFRVRQPHARLERRAFALDTHFFRRLVAAQAQENGMAHHAVAGDVCVAHLRYQVGLHPLDTTRQFTCDCHRRRLTCKFRHLL